VSRTHYYYFRGGGEGFADDGGDAILWVRFCSTVPRGRAVYSAAADAADAAAGSFGIPVGKRAARPGHSITAMGFSFSFQSERYTGTPTPHHHAITAAAAAAAAASLATVFSRARIMFTARFIYHARPSHRPFDEGPVPSPNAAHHHPASS